MARSKFMARSKYNHHTMARSIEWVLLLHHRSIITQSDSISMQVPKIWYGAALGHPNTLALHHVE